MSNQIPKKFYWIEGVTRKEVESALSANRYPALYRQSTRRALVVSYVTGLGALLTSPLARWEKLGSYVEGISLLLLIFLFLVLRRSIRMIAEAPTELLDERFVALRDRSYLGAYRWFLGIVGFLIGFAWTTTPTLDHETLLAPTLFLAMLGTALPSMILAWRLPSEDFPE